MSGLEDLIAELVRKISGNRPLLVATGQIARTDTAFKDLFQIVAGMELHFMLVTCDTGSNAGTSAVLDVGVPAFPQSLLSSHSVLGAAGTGVKSPDARNLGTISPSDQQIVGRYTETGAASSAGGPWTVLMLYSHAGN